MMVVVTMMMMMGVLQNLRAWHLSFRTAKLTAEVPPQVHASKAWALKLSHSPATAMHLVMVIVMVMGMVF